MDDKIAAWLDYLASQRGLAPSTQREYRRDMRLLVAHLVDREGRHFLAGVAQQHGPITDVGDITAKHLAAFLVPLNLADPGRRSPRPADAETTATSCLLPHTPDKIGAFLTTWRRQISRGRSVQDQNSRCFRVCFAFLWRA